MNRIKTIKDVRCVIQRRLDRAWKDLPHCKEQWEIEANHAERDTLEYVLRLLNEIDPPIPDTKGQRMRNDPAG